jgi:hypothetical protein
VSYDSTDGTPNVYTKTYTQCYNPSTSALYEQAFSKVTWASNYTKLTTIFSQSSDGYTLTSSTKTALTGSSAYLYVKATFTYNTKSTITNTIYLYYKSQKISGVSATSSTVAAVKGSSIASSNMKGTKASGNGILTYFVECPENIFSSSSQYNQLCKIGSDGDFSIDTTNLNVIANYNYYFKLYA